MHRSARRTPVSVLVHTSNAHYIASTTLASRGNAPHPRKCAFARRVGVRPWKAIVKKVSTCESANNASGGRRPTRQEAEAAVRTLLAWAGDNPEREGLKETPRRVADAFDEYFRGYTLDAIALLQEPTFEEVGGYDDLIMLRDVRVESHCEHHIAPFIGVAHVAYVPNAKVAGLSKLARVVEVFAKRLQTQEALTAQIADAIERALAPRGVAVMVEAVHYCMATRGVQQPGAVAVTTRFLGAFDADSHMRQRFLSIAQSPRYQER
jgi:GTP cyclohydrolase I